MCIYESCVGIMLVNIYIYMYRVFVYCWRVGILVVSSHVSCVGIMVVSWYTGCDYLCTVCLDTCCELGHMLFACMYHVLG